MGVLAPESISLVHDCEEDRNPLTHTKQVPSIGAFSGSNMGAVESCCGKRGMMDRLPVLPICLPLSSELGTSKRVKT